MSAIIRQLFIKDLEQNQKALALFAISAAGFPAAFYLITSPAGESDFIGLVFTYIVFGAPALLAFWFVGQEKLKGTFRLLRLLPVPPEHVITTKVSTSAGICVLLVNIVVVGEPLLFSFAGYSIQIPSALTIIWLNATTIAIASFTSAAYTIFDHKVASQIVYWLLAVMVLGFAAAGKYLPKAGINPSVLWAKVAGAWYFAFGGPIVLIAITVVVARYAGRVFKNRDWTELEED